MNDANLQACSPRTGHSNGFLPSSVRAIFRSASTIASTVRSAGLSVASTITLTDEDRQCEQVQWAGFDKIELSPANVRRVLLLTYANGFQVWDVENADEVCEIISKRDGPVTFLRVQPQPIETSAENFKSAHPLLLVVTSDTPNCRNNGTYANGYSAVVASPPSVGETPCVPTVVKFYSLQCHSYVHTLRFPTAILAVRCSPRVVAVALATQLYCFNAATLQSTFSVLTYPSPQLGSSVGYGALAVGPRWLAYAANQPLISNTGRVSPQYLTPSPGVSPSTSPANGSLDSFAHYAKESSKQLAAGIVSLGDIGYKAFSRYCTEGVGSPVSGSPFLKSSCNGHTDHAGTVIVHDFVTKIVVSQFRAHDSPLSALSFDPTGTLLVTASIHGHNINIFRILPAPNMNGTNTSSYDTNSSHAHLYKLSRGLTNAVIQDIAFSEDSHWVVVSSSRGTHHLFAISPFGGAVGPSTHGAGLVECSLGLLPWWSNRGPLKSSQHVSGPSPATVNSSVVSRKKIGNGGWRGTMSGAAAAASGRSCSSLGAVAVVFHDGRGQKLDTEMGPNTLKEQLWVVSPSGDLFRHALHLSAGTEGHSDSISSPMVAGIQKEVLDFKVVVEPLQKWDLCRKLNWVEREENVNISNALNVAHDGAGNSTHSTMIKAVPSQNDTTIGKLGTIFKETTNKQTHQWFLSNAEVHMHHLRPPIWASSQISFHVLSGPAFNKVLRKDDFGGEFEIEKVVSRVVEVRKKDLVPVFDMFSNYRLGQDVSLSSDASYIPKGRLNRLNLQSTMQFGFSTDVGGSQSQRSSSGSSCGSEGSLYSGPNVGLNNGHHSYEDRSLDLQFQHMNSFFVLEPHQHFHAQGGKPQDTHSPSINLFKSKKDMTSASVDFLPMNIPYLSHGDSYVMDSKRGGKPGVSCLDVLQEVGRVSVPLHDKDTGTDGGNDMSSPCKNQLTDAGHIPNGCFSNHEGFECIDPAAATSDGRWMSCAIEEAHPSLRSQTVVSDKSSECLPSAIGKNLEKFDLQDYEAATDVESTDGNSKSEDFGGEHGEDLFEGERGEDGWEGALFPFVEDS